MKCHGGSTWVPVCADICSTARLQASPAAISEKGSLIMGGSPGQAGMPGATGTLTSKNSHPANGLSSGISHLAVQAGGHRRKHFLSQLFAICGTITALDLENAVRFSLQYLERFG